MPKKRAAAASPKKKGKSKKGTKKTAKGGKKRKHMSRAERLTHYNNLVLNFGSRYEGGACSTHEKKIELAKELIRALRWEMKRNVRTVTHIRGG